MQVLLIRENFSGIESWLNIFKSLQLHLTNLKIPKMELIMNKQNLEEFKYRIIKKFPQLTESDLQHKEGKEERMMKKIAYKLRMTKYQIHVVILDF